MFGRYVLGIASALLGIASLVLRDQLISDWQLPGDGVFLIVTSAALIAGGFGMLVRGWVPTAALVLAGVYLLATLTMLPAIFQQPGVYASWGDVFYPLLPALGALFVYGLASPAARYALILVGVCNASYAIEQVEFLSRTASLVPAWMPLGGTFWAVATTVAFGLAAIALVSGVLALLAARLTAAMFALFTVGVWVPILIADPRTHSNWSEGLETLAITGAMWIVADQLAASIPSFSLSERVSGEVR
jgi:hypothetical protein